MGAIIAKQIRLARDAFRLSAEEAATSLNVDPEELKRWEEGLSEPSLEQTSPESAVPGW